MNNPQASSYAEEEVLNAGPERLVEMLYEIGAQAIASARESNAKRDIMGRTSAINKAFAVLVELQGGLNFEAGEVAAHYASLYDYCQKRLLEANVTQSDEILAEVESLFGECGQTWKTVIGGTATMLPVVPEILAGRHAAAGSL